jgi:hypothetical protein
MRAFTFKHFLRTSGRVSAKKREATSTKEKTQIRTFSSFCRKTLEDQYQSPKPLGSHVLAVLSWHSCIRVYCGEPAISHDSHHVSLVQWTNLFASRHKGHRFKSPGGNLCETGILLLAMSCYTIQVVLSWRSWPFFSCYPVLAVFPGCPVPIVLL